MYEKVLYEFNECCWWTVIDHQHQPQPQHQHQRLLQKLRRSFWLSLMWVRMSGVFVAWPIGHTLISVSEGGLMKMSPPVSPSSPGGRFAHESKFCGRSRKAAAHCLFEHGGGSDIFVLLEEDRWFCVWLSPGTCSLMSVQAAVMASGCSRDQGYRQQVVAATG